MINSDTIAAVATSYGVGSISIVRVSGELALNIAKKLSKKESFTPRVATLSKLYSKENLVDEAIIIYFKSPYSFTREDIVEFQTHGGIALCQIILDEVIALGARLARPGEFTKRAFLNGKIDLTKANAIAKIIEAKSEDSVKSLAKHLNGDLKKFVDEVREELVTILAYTEVTIDYAEDDLPEDIFILINKKLKILIKKLQKIIHVSKSKEGILTGFKVAIIGKPNVGKSSILNALLQEDRAIVSDIQGTTRDTIEEEIKLGTHLVKFVDTAGIRDTTEAIEKIGIKKSQNAIEISDTIIVVFDISETLSKEDLKILDLIKSTKDKKIFVVFNKMDKEHKLNEDEFKDFNVLKISSEDNVDVLLGELKRYFDSRSDIDELIFSSKEQINSVINALENLESSVELLNENDLELFAFHMNEAIYFISSITKGFDRSEILDEMFSSFCLGK
jgi:tRNA modification GTPase